MGDPEKRGTGLLGQPIIIWPYQDRPGCLSRLVGFIRLWFIRLLFLGIAFGLGYVVGLQAG